MQKAIALFLAVLFISLTSIVQAQTEPDIIDYKLKAGDVLTYEVVEGSKKQLLKLQLTTAPAGDFKFAELTFDWTKAGEKNDQSGKVKYKGTSADDYNLLVTSCFRIDFDNLNYNQVYPYHGLWLSGKAQMDVLLNGEEFGITLLDDKEITKYTLEKKVYYPATTYYGKPCRIKNAKYKSATNAENFMMIQDGDVNPLIMALYLKERDFLIKLVSIEEGKLNTVAATPAPPVQPAKAAAPAPPAKQDSDRDGIPDDLDKCINEREDKDGFEDLDGCPEKDNDNDGVEDMYDNCPDTKGSANNSGCP